MQNKSNHSRKIILWIENNVPNEYNYKITKYATICQFDFQNSCYQIINKSKYANINNINTDITSSQYMTLTYYSDAVRLALLYVHGGCWFDLDVFFLRNFDPIFSSFSDKICVYQWESFNVPNNAIIISLQPFSKALRLTINLMIQRNKGFGFMIANMKYTLPCDLFVLPCSWFDSNWLHHNKLFRCPEKYQFDVFFKSTNGIECNFNNFFPGAFCYHWHNCWDVDIADDSPIRQLDLCVNAQLYAQTINVQ